jgi:hypothetical protein
VVLGLEERMMLASGPAAAAVAAAPSPAIPAFPDYQGLSVKRVPGFLAGLTVNNKVVTPDNLIAPYDSVTIGRQLDNATVDYWAVTLNKLDELVLTLQNSDSTIAKELDVRIWGPDGKEIGNPVPGGQFSYVAGENGTYIVGISKSTNTAYPFNPEGTQTPPHGPSLVDFSPTFKAYPGANTDLMKILKLYTLPWPNWEGTPKQTALNTLTTIATAASNQPGTGIINFGGFEQILGSPTLPDINAWLTNTWKPFSDILSVAPAKKAELAKAEYIYSNTDSAILQSAFPPQPDGLQNWMAVAQPFIENQSLQDAYVDVDRFLAQANLYRSDIDTFLKAMISWKQSYQIIVGQEPTRIAGFLTTGLTKIPAAKTVPEYGWLTTLLGSAVTIISGIVNVAGGGPEGALITSILLNAIVNPIDAWLRGDFNGGNSPIDQKKVDTSTKMQDAAALIQNDSTAAFEASFNLLSSPTFETSLWSNYGLFQAMKYVQFSSGALGAPTPQTDSHGNAVNLTPRENDLRSNYDFSVWSQLLPKMFHWKEMPYTDYGPPNTLRNFSFFVPLKETATWQQLDFLPPGLNGSGGVGDWGYSTHTLALAGGENQMTQEARDELVHLQAGQPFNYGGHDFTPDTPYPNGPWFGPGPLSFPDDELRGNSGSLYTITTNSHIEETNWRHEPSSFSYWRTDASLSGDTIHEWALVTSADERMGQVAADQLFGTGSLVPAGRNWESSRVYAPGGAKSSYTYNFQVQSGGVATRFDAFTTWGKGVDQFSPYSFQPQTYQGMMSMGKVPTNPYIPSDWTFHFDNYYADPYNLTYGTNLPTRPPGPPPRSGYGAGIDAFVTTLYREQLGRNPGRDGLRYWGGLLARGMTPATVAQAIWNSAEHRALLSSHTAPPISLARSFADAIGAWGAEKRRGAFHIGAFVTVLYREQLGRNPGRDALQYWARRLASGMTPTGVAQAIWDSPEHKALLSSHTAPPISLSRSFADAIGAAIHASRTTA